MRDYWVENPGKDFLPIPNNSQAVIIQAILIHPVQAASVASTGQYRCRVSTLEPAEAGGGLDSNAMKG